MKHFYQTIDVVATPVGKVHIASEFCVRCFVGIEWRLAVGVGIEVVVHVDGVDVVALHYVADYLADILAIFFVGGVEKCLTVVLEEAMRLAIDEVVLWQHFFG